MTYQGQRYYQRNAAARLRRTSYGGAAFLPDRLATVELNESAFAIVCWLAVPLTTKELRLHLRQRFQRNITLANVDRIVRELAGYGFVDSIQTEKTAADSIPCEPESIPYAPESIHIQLTNRCNLNCPACYIAKKNDVEDSLPLQRWISLIDEISKIGVFQVAFGGGEPLLSPHFIPLVQHAKFMGVVPNVTTNGTQLDENTVQQICHAIGEVRLSVQDGVSLDPNLLREKLRLLQKYKTRFGFNLIVTHRNVGEIDSLLRGLAVLNPASITLIRPKPSPHNREWYAENALSAQDSTLLLAKLNALESLFTKTQLTIDCALSYLFYNFSEDTLVKRGVFGCAMAERFVVIAANGDVYPCSHLHAKEFLAGNILESPFSKAWENNHIFAAIRSGLKNVEGICKNCVKQHFCGGCRAIMRHTTGNLWTEDVACPKLHSDGW